MSNRFFEIEKKANELRKQTLDMCINAETGHVTSCMSCAEIMTVLYYGDDILRHDPKNPSWEDRDRFILSKGQASPILYATLADRGFFPREWLQRFALGDDGAGRNAPFGVHLQCDVPGVEFTTGSLGHGLGYGAGIALTAKQRQKDFLTYVLLGDGELYEGSNWEVAPFASHHQLGIIAIVDRNGMCTNDLTENIVALEPLADKWVAAGWNVRRVNGHSMKDLYGAMSGLRSNGHKKPLAIIAETEKGHGIKSMVGKPYWHGEAPKDKDKAIARRDLDEFISAHLERGGYY